jgi:four helix bundle protein
MANFNMEIQSSKLKSQNYNSKLKTELKYRTYQFSLSVIKVLINLPQNKTIWVISDQLLRAATSIGANIVEAQAASSKRDFVKFYEIALKSANETKYWLCLLRDCEMIKDREKVNKVLQEAIEIARILGSSVLTLKGKNKFKL